jgi:hypothetical protein
MQLNLWGLSIIETIGGKKKEKRQGVVFRWHITRDERS